MTSLFHTTRGLPNGVIIFCHGSGDTGMGAKSYVEGVAPHESLSRLREAGIEFEYPTAPARPYRLNGGYPTNVWFDRIGGMAPTHSEDTKSVEPNAARLNELIDDLIEKKGIPPNKIALGGFSMGGGIALQTAARSRHSLGAVFAMSSYLCHDSWVFAHLERQQQQQQQCENGTSTTHETKHVGLLSKDTPVFMAHGDADDFVRFNWGEATASRLGDLGVNVQQFVRVPFAGHEMTDGELQLLFDFLMDALVQEDSKKAE